MPLNPSIGNMYEFITHTWNPIKGKCFHDCLYCYMKRWGHLKPVRLEQKEFKTDLGTGNFIFVGSSCDIWAKDIPQTWIWSTINHCAKFNNKYLFQTKNPEGLRRIIGLQYEYCITIESNRFYPKIMVNSPTPYERAYQTSLIRLKHPIITIEPILDFDFEPFVNMIQIYCQPIQVNIGADSLGHKLPEPPKSKILELIAALSTFTTVHQKSNLKRLLK